VRDIYKRARSDEDINPKREGRERERERERERGVGFNFH
jgi:hypothetical protein